MQGQRADTQDGPATHAQRGHGGPSDRRVPGLRWHGLRGRVGGMGGRQNQLALRPPRPANNPKETVNDATYVRGNQLPPPLS